LAGASAERAAPWVAARSVIVMDEETGEILYGKNPDLVIGHVRRHKRLPGRRHERIRRGIRACPDFIGEIRQNTPCIRRSP